MSRKQTDGPFHVVTDRRLMTYLPAHYAEYIKNDARFSFTEFAHRVSEANMRWKPRVLLLILTIRQGHDGELTRV